MKKILLKGILGACIMALVFEKWGEISPITMIFFLCGFGVGMFSGIQLERKLFPEVRRIWSAFRRILKENKVDDTENPAPTTGDTVSSSPVSEQPVEHPAAQEVPSHIYSQTVSEPVNMAPINWAVELAPQTDGQAVAHADTLSDVPENIPKETATENIPAASDVPPKTNSTDTFNVSECIIPEDLEVVDVSEAICPDADSRGMEFDAFDLIPPELPEEGEKEKGGVTKSKEYVSLDDMLREVG